MAALTAGHNWEYKDDPRHRDILKTATAAFLLKLGLKEFAAPEDAQDTRATHKLLFRDLAPVLQPYFAGNYRGSGYLGLQRYEVKVDGDPRVGYPCVIVSSCMDALARSIGEAVKTLDATKLGTQTDKHLINSVLIVAELLNKFFLIHPYANGNGHTGRALVWLLLTRYGYFPQRLAVNQSPNYHESLVRLRNGDKAPLTRFLLTCMVK